MTEEWLWRSYFSQRLLPVELEYGPITAPSVRATRAGSYLCLFQVPPPKKLWQGPIQPVAVPQDLGPIRYTPPCTPTHTKTDYLQQRQNLPISVRQHWQVLWEVPIEINRGHSHTPLFYQPSLPLPPNTQWDSFRAPCGWRRTVTKLLRGGKLDNKEGTYLAVVHLPHDTSKDREHTYTVCRMPASARRQKAIRNMALMGIHYS